MIFAMNFKTVSCKGPKGRSEKQACSRIAGMTLMGKTPGSNCGINSFML